MILLWSIGGKYLSFAKNIRQRQKNAKQKKKPTKESIRLYLLLLFLVFFSAVFQSAYSIVFSNKRARCAHRYFGLLQIQ